MAKLPTDLVRESRQFLIGLSHLIGMEMPSGEKFSPRLLAIAFSMILLQVMHSYGLYESRNDIIAMCDSMALYTIAFQLAARMGRHVLLNDNSFLDKTFELILKFYEREQETIVYRPVLFRNLRHNDFILKTYLIVIVIGYHTPAATAWIMPFFTGKYLMFAPLYIPLTDPTEFYGFVLNMSILTGFTSIVNAVFVAGDAYIIFIALQVTTMSEILELKLKELGKKLTEPLVVLDIQSPQPSTSRIDEIENNEKEEKEAREKLETELISLIKEFHEYNDYIKKAVEYAEFTFFMVIVFNSLAIGLSLVVLIYFSIPIGIVYLLVLFLQAAMPCFIGTMVEIQNQKLLDNVWSFPWYELSLKNQKVYLQFIHACQNVHAFDLMMIGHLDMEMFSGVMNGAYSYMMYIVNFM